ncbi:8-amino-7-oxononanoate synthase [Propionispora sp. 2/2-37]|uniref:8-amino-7-oxononanoate synthase n=1 Tax=Propionispora sp. 2/2-37 TaxID=1677858 RepID=UPI0006BB6B42|nr:8-amino-7-oxononanoate synthase [Propionispora sp. 2/2-37]CUH96818.1 8-amino-7-oxononanoate synthase [Propionispora sp. 2/2-37]
MHFLTDALAQMKSRRLYRQAAALNPINPLEVEQNSQKYLLLASNNYLSLTHHPSVQKAAMAAIAAYGTGAGGARLTTGSHPLFAQLEQELAAFKGTEAALVFNTGYMANLGIISALADNHDAIFSDELNHASIIDGCRLSRARVVVYRHNDMDHLGQLLANTSCQGKKLIVTDGVFSMDGDIAPLDKLTDLAGQHNAIVIVDDAHATGVLGSAGKGTAAFFGVSRKVQVQMGTLSKALAAEGGFVAGSTDLIDYLRNKARSFIFSTALSPATTAAALAALRELSAHPDMVERLGENAQYLRARLKANGLNIPEGITPIIAVIVGGEEHTLKLADELKEQGIMVSAIRPPTVPAGTSRLRLTVTAGHDRRQLATAADKIAAAARQLGIL